MESNSGQASSSTAVRHSIKHLFIKKKTNLGKSFETTSTKCPPLFFQPNDLDGLWYFRNGHLFQPIYEHIHQPFIILDFLISVFVWCLVCRLKRVTKRHIQNGFPVCAEFMFPSPLFKIETESRMKLDHNWNWQLMSLNRSQLWKIRLFCSKKNLTFSGSYELETTSDKSNSCSCFVQVSPSSISLEIFAHQATLQIMKKVHQKTNLCQYLQERARSSSREGFFL